MRHNVCDFVIRPNSQKVFSSQNFPPYKAIAVCIVGGTITNNSDLLHVHCGITYDVNVDAMPASVVLLTSYHPDRLC